MHAPLLDYLCLPRRLAAHLPRFERQGHRVNGLGRRVQQQARDVERTLFVFEDGLPAFEGEFPESQAPAQSMPVLVSLSVVSSQLSRSHKSRHPYGGKPGFPKND